jgi:hypothetical protein
MNIQIVEYIRGRLQAGESEGKIRNDLLANGWTDADINEAMASLTSQDASITGQPLPTKNTSKIIIISIIVLVLLGFSAVFAIKIYKTDSKQKINTETTVDNIEKTNISETFVSPSPAPENTNSVSTSSDLWTVYDKMILALKNKEIPAFNTVSYVQVTPDQVSQFSQMASYLYDESVKIIKNDYVNKWQDDRQAIYSTNPKKADDAEVYRYTHGSVMFVNIDGVWKVLSNSPEVGTSVSKKGTNRTATQIEQDLLLMMLDSDKDGISDQEETCSELYKYNSKCVKTDPNKRDSNGNGLWDGIDAEMN